MENEHSIAYEMLGELKKNNKRLFIFNSQNNEKTFYRPTPGHLT